MANPTTNFGWVMPSATSLVTNLPADFNTFGQGVDTTMADLKGGTTGQVLAKASNTDMDFVWTADAAGMTNPMTTTGDTIYSSSGSTPARLGIGSNGQVLTVASGIPSWATPTSPAFVGAYAYKSAGQSISSGSNTLQTFDLESFDTDGFHSTTTNTARMTIPSGQAGKYLIVGHTGLGQASQTGSPYWIWLEKNGSNIAYNTQIMVNSGMANRCGIVTIADLAVGDYVTMSVYYSDSSTGQETPAGISGTFLSIAKL